MNIKSIKLTDFKRFTDLNIDKIPKEAKLVVMIGPNGSGKSSVLESLQLLRLAKGFGNWSGVYDYYYKSERPSDSCNLQNLLDNLIIDVHGELPNTQNDWKKAFQVRSSYRNDPTVESSQRSSLAPLEQKQHRLVENDASVMDNYLWLQSRWAEISSHLETYGVDPKSLQDQIFGKLRDAMRRLFDNPELILMGLGNRDERRIFQFKKGASREFSYMNLSSGEKAALDLLLDLIVAKEQFDDTVFAIDEPEAHIHTKLQGPLLGELYDLVSNNSQLWIATHSIGMVRKARDLWRENEKSVIFLDFGRESLDFDKDETITPTLPDPDFWARTYEDALGDLAELVLTERAVFCEGRGFDADCYENIFKNRYPELRFISLEGRGNVEKSVAAANLALEKIAKKAKVIGIIDGDKATENDEKRNAKKGILTLSRKSIESYLLDDEVLTKLCKDFGASDKVEGLLNTKHTILRKSMAEGKSKSCDDLKPIAQDIHVAAQKTLESVKLGNSKESFMTDMLAPRIQLGMVVYQQLHDDTFGRLKTSLARE